MDFLLNPNIAYLMLVFGFSLAVMAFFAPGTGILEIIAFFALLGAGYGVYNLPINIWALLVLFIGVIPFILALRRSGRNFFLIIAIVAFVVGSTFLFRGDHWWDPAVNPILATVLSILVAGFFWIAIRKTLEAERTQPSHDLNALIGQTGEAKTDVNFEGSVQVDGELWSAHSDKPIPNGAQVRVLAREGFTLTVEQID
jgi:membrane-bound serine protease (ClpP class)